MVMVWYEIKKVLLRPSCQIALLLLLILAGHSCYQVLGGAVSESWINEDGHEEIGYAAMQKLRTARKEWSGTLNQEMLEKALAELKQLDSEQAAHQEDPDYAYKRYQGLLHIRELLNQSFKKNYRWDYGDYFLAESVDEEQLPLFYENRLAQLKNWLYEENSMGNQLFSEAEKQYLINIYESLETPFEVGYTTGWEMAFKASYYVILYGSILMAFLISGLFAIEFRWKTGAIYFSTESGRKNGTGSKLAAGFLLTTVVYWTILLTVNLIVLSILGFDGANCQIQTGKNLWNSIYNITFAQRSVLALTDGYILWLFLSALTMLVSAISGSVSLSATIPTLLMLGTDFLDRRGYVDSVSKILLLFPHKMANVDYASRGIVLYSVFGNIMQPITIQRIIYPCITLVMAIACYQIFRRKQVS